MCSNLIKYDDQEIKGIIDASDASKSEADFICNVQEYLKGSNVFLDLADPDRLMSIKNDSDVSGFFSFLKLLDRFLLGDSLIQGRIFDETTGYYTEDEIYNILKFLFVQRYVNAHDEDNKTEKIKEAALQDFISDKYDSGVHFFEEILQNIDDAFGRKNKKSAETEDDEVEIKWNSKEITFTYPDHGFSFYDLMAITSLGNSIKKGDIDQASIGEKGIGFKSVFSVATKICIQSRFFGFDIEYDEKRKTSVLQPSTISLPGTGAERTSVMYH